MLLAFLVPLTSPKQCCYCKSVRTCLSCEIGRRSKLYDKPGLAAPRAFCKSRSWCKSKLICNTIDILARGSGCFLLLSISADKIGPRLFVVSTWGICVAA